MNSSQVSYFTLSAYFDTGLLRYFFFMIILCLYLLVVSVNVLLMVIICVNRSFREPMYLFLCSLFVNELYGSSGLFPFLLLQVLSDVHTVPASLCFLQIFCLYSYASVEFLNLTVMSYDRYVAICCPLQYNAHMTCQKITVLISVSWICASGLSFLPILMSVPLQLCGNIIDKVYCDNYSIVKLACSDTTVNNIYGLIGTVLVVICPVCFILYTYIRILTVCFSGCKQTRQKAVSTCSPHLASLLNFSFGCFFEVVQSRFDMGSVPNMLRIVLSLYFLTSQPLFSPLIYGLNLLNLRNVIKNRIFTKA